MQPKEKHSIYVRNADSMEPPMSLEALPVLVGIAVAMTQAPGPNNPMLSASGAAHGWRRSAPHVMGVTVGIPVMLVLVALGFERVLAHLPRPHTHPRMDRLTHAGLADLAHRDSGWTWCGGLSEHERRLGLMAFAGCQLCFLGRFAGRLAGGWGLLVVGAARAGTG